MLLFTSSCGLFSEQTLPGPFENYFESIGDGAIVTSSDYGRNGGSGVRLLTNSVTIGQRGHLFKGLAGSRTTLLVGMAVRVESTNLANPTENGRADDLILLTLLDDGTAQVTVALTPSMRIVALDGNGAQLGRSTFFLKENVFYYLEARLVVSNVAGSVDVQVDGVTRLAVLGDTQKTANANVNGVRFGAISSQGNTGRYVRFDDIYIADTTGVTNNDFLGDIRVEGLLPTVDGRSQQWSAMSGTLLAAQIDDPQPDNDTTYIFSGTVGDRVTAVFSDLETPSGLVLGVQMNMVARKTTPGLAAIAPIYGSIGATADGATVYLPMSYETKSEITETDPILGGAHSIPRVNTLQYGLVRIA